MRVAHRKLHSGRQNSHTYSCRHPSSKLWGMMINRLMGCFTSAAGHRCQWAHRVWGRCLILLFVLRVAGFMWGPRWMRHAVNFFIYAALQNQKWLNIFLPGCFVVRLKELNISWVWNDLKHLFLPLVYRPSPVICDEQKGKILSPHAIRERVTYSILCIV